MSDFFASLVIGAILGGATGIIGVIYQVKTSETGEASFWGDLIHSWSWVWGVASSVLTFLWASGMVDGDMLVASYVALGSHVVVAYVVSFIAPIFSVFP